MSKEEEELLALCLNKDTRQAGFNRLVLTYQEQVYWLIRKMVLDHDTADDLTQDVFVKVYQKLEKFKGESALYTWIYRIATNTTLNHLNREKRRRMLSLSSMEQPLPDLASNEEDLDVKTTEQNLLRCIHKLPAKQRLVFQLRYDDKSFKEIAEILGTSEGSLKANYHHARKKIEKCLGIH